MKTRPDTLTMDEARKWLISHPDQTVRVSTAVMQQAMLHQNGTLITHGRVRHIVARRVVAGVYELSLKPIGESSHDE